LTDFAIALTLGTIALLITAFGDAWSPDDESIDAWALTLVALAFMALAVRRRRPLTTLAVTTLATSIYLIQSYPYGPILAAFFIAVYTVASRLPLTKSATAVAVAVAVLLTHVFIHPSALGGWIGIIPGSAWAIVPFAIGTTVRVTREARDAARAESVRHQVYEERIRLAQEVHDIVGHGLAAIQMQADIALHVDEQQTPRTRAALESISRASSESFDELRNTLDVISGTRETPRAPIVPGLDDIEALCDRIGSTGVHVELTMAAARPEVATSVGTAAYRVVQESLTNVMRHGAVPVVTVDIDFTDGIMELKVVNPGPVSADRSDGHGIDGMRRRVETAGGTLHAGASADGFEVKASIPTRETT
jgi:signal transduction histidine kinase